MRGLIYKDFIVNLKNIVGAFISMILIATMLILAILGGEDAEEMKGMFIQLIEIFIYAIMFFLSGAFQGNMFREDESRRWSCFVVSTPMMSRKQVESKYWLIMIISFCTFWLISFVDLACCIVYDTVSVGLILSFMFCIQIILRAFEIPFIIRFGSEMGGYYKSGVLLVFVLVGGIYLLFGDISHFSSMEKIYDMILNMITGENRSFQIIVTAIPYISLSLYYLSYKISCSLYLKGAENFEK